MVFLANDRSESVLPQTPTESEIQTVIKTQLYHSYNRKKPQRPMHLIVHFCLPEGNVITEETNTGEGVTRAIDGTDTDASQRRKSRAKSVTLKDEALIRSNSGFLYLCNMPRTVPDHCVMNQLESRAFTPLTGEPRHFPLRQKFRIYNLSFTYYI